MSVVGCKTWDELLDICKRSARDHLNFVLNVSAAIGDGALLASKEAARLARRCKETRAHLRQEHADLVGKAGSS